MSKVTRLRRVLPMSPDISAAVSALDKAIADAVDAAKEAGLPQGPDRWIAPRSRTRTDTRDGDAMTASIHDITDQRPHLMVVASDGAHVIPRALVQSVIAGDKPSSILTEPVVQRIIEEWLQQVTK